MYKGRMQPDVLARLSGIRNDRVRFCHHSARRASRNISFENASSSTARAKISAPTIVESMRIESPRAERLNRQGKLVTIFSMTAFRCAVNGPLTCTVPQKLQFVL